MYKIDKKTLQKAALITLVGRFNIALYGEVRLQKLMYLINKMIPNSFYTFKRYYYGQYSEEIKKLLEELSKTNTIKIYKFHNQLNIFKVWDKIILSKAKKLLEKTYPEILNAIAKVVNEYGYLKEGRLKKKLYELNEIDKLEYGEILIKENLPSEKVIKVDEDIDEIEDFELSINPHFTKPIINFVRGLQKVKLSPEMKKALFDE